jgi:hypothetical protein
MTALRQGLHEPFAGPLTQLTNVTIDGRAVGQARQEVDGPARRLATTGFTVIEEFAECPGPQAGRDGGKGGRQSVDRIHGVTRLGLMRTVLNLIP